VAKGTRLDVLDLETLARLNSRVTLVYDGWSIYNRIHYTDISIQYIASDLIFVCREMNVHNS
jgi:hypothetical protein